MACSEGLRAGSTDPTQADSNAAAPHDGGQDAGTGTAVRGVQDAGLDVNDVSFLFPRPNSIDGVGELIGMTDVGPNGVILPRARLYQVLYFASGYSAGALYAALRVVSARLDPCFPRGPEPTGCSKQIRLVAQPLVLGDGVPVQAVDAPIHLVCELSDDAFRSRGTDWVRPPH